jgi:uncharacterized protein (DUF433 family)
MIPKISHKRKKISKFIYTNPQVQGGKPCIIGTRVPIEVVFSYLSQGFAIPVIMRTFRLRKEHVLDVLNYAKEKSKDFS